MSDSPWKEAEEKINIHIGLRGSKRRRRVNKCDGYNKGSTLPVTKPAPSEAI